MMQYPQPQPQYQQAPPQQIVLPPPPVDLSMMPVQGGFGMQQQQPSEPYMVDDYMDEEEMRERRDHIHKINLYVHHFKKELEEAHIALPQLSDLSTEDLELLHEEMKLVVSCRNSNKVNVGAFFYGLSQAEILASAVTPLRLQGLTSRLQSNEDTEKLLHQVFIKYSKMCYSEPEWQLAYQIVQNAAITHKVNTMQTDLKVAAAKMFTQPKPVRPELVQKYKDL